MTKARDKVGQLAGCERWSDLLLSVVYVNIIFLCCQIFQKILWWGGEVGRMTNVDCRFKPFQVVVSPSFCVQQL